jgi:glycosyltransferase involved in cell wall biosynthesis
MFRTSTALALEIEHGAVPGDHVNRPLVTIGICAFNSEDTVGAALRSALAQTWRPIEIIVVDDASADKTGTVVRAIAARHDNVSIVVNERNLGHAGAVNQVVQRASGEFVAFFDDDDVSRPERVERQLKRLTTYERKFSGGAPVVCHTAREQIYPNGRQRIEPTKGTIEGRAAPSGIAVARRILMGTPLRDGYGSCATCSEMARTEVYRALGGYDTAFRRVDDTDFCVRLARAGGHFPGIAEPLVVQTMTNTTDKNLAREKEYTLALLEKHRDLFEDEALYRYCCEWTELKDLWLRSERLAFARRLARLSVRSPFFTLLRMYTALPGVEGNLAFRQFHRGPVLDG